GLSQASASGNHASRVQHGMPRYRVQSLIVVKNTARKLKSKVSSARSAAFDVLMRVGQEDSYASELLHSSKLSHLSGADHGLATEIVMGVLRWQSSLDAAIAKVSTQRLQKMDPEVLVALRMGAYQLLYLERVPAHAAVHESVELVRRARKSSAVAFLNAVLRKLSAAKLAMLLGSGKSARNLMEQYAHPEWLVARWAAQYGWETAEAICAYDQKVPRISVRFRDAGVEEELKKENIEFAPGALLTSARIVLSGNVARTQAFKQGRVGIQDEASQLVALLVGEGRVLDCCAAPGGKTALLANRNTDAKIVAVDIHPHRARLLRNLVGAANVMVVAADARQLPFSAQFENVLVDAPCSGTGTLARNPEIKWKLRPEDLDDLRTRQLEILRSAAARTTSGGKVVYSTCSLEPDENQQVIEQFLSEHPSFKILKCSKELERLKSQGELGWGEIDSLVKGPYLRTIPGIHPCDGFFTAIMQRY